MMLGAVDAAASNHHDTLASAHQEVEWFVSIMMRKWADYVISGLKMRSFPFLLFNFMLCTSE
jgi:hypothetical protein